MGVPYFYTWITTKFPMMKRVIDEQFKPVFDNLYLDINGIIHKCCKDENLFKTQLNDKKKDILWFSIFNYLNEVINHVRPGKLIFIAIDGVAPRAKMNQQRSRRYKSAKADRSLNQKLKDLGVGQVDTFYKNNCISPGTELMQELGYKLKYFVQKKMIEDPNWQGVKVILTDSNTPGEGEHKIFQYIRQDISRKDYDKKTSHCVYGADSDLIILSLTTQVPFMTIIREVFVPPQGCSKAAERRPEKIQYEYIYINILREYLQLEFKKYEEYLDEYDLQRIIDDWIFMLIFIGNDFLPKLYCFEIRKGQLDELIDIFKDYLKSNSGYITDQGTINWQRALILMNMIAVGEAGYLKEKLQQKKLQKRLYSKSSYFKKMEMKKNKNHQDTQDKKKEKEVVTKPKRVEPNELEDEIINILFSDKSDDDSSDNNEKEKDQTVDKKPVLEEVKEEFQKLEIQKVQSMPEKSQKEEEITYVNSIIINDDGSTPQERDLTFMKNLYEAYREDPETARMFYYEEKFKANIKTKPGIQKLTKICQKYIEGLQFILHYYYTYTPSWSWYYPFYYSPMIMDIIFIMNELSKEKGLKEIEKIFQIKFKQDEPQDPYLQLLLILPPGNHILLPKAYGDLMIGETSQVKEFFPVDFKVDMFGGSFEHDYIALLPFININKLLAAYNSIDISKLSPTEQDRNKTKPYLVYTYNDQAQPRLLKSPFPEVFSDVLSKIELSETMFNEFVTNRLVKRPVIEETAEPSLPSLLYKEIKKIKWKEIVTRKRTKIVMQVRITTDLHFKDQTKFKQYLGTTVHSSYPYLKQGKIIGFIFSNNETLLSGRYTPSCLKQVYDYYQSNQIFQKLKNEIYDKNRENPYSISERNMYLVIVESNERYKKNQRGNVVGIKPVSNIFASYELIFGQLSQYRENFEDYSSLEEEYPVGKTVALLTGKHSGCLGEIMPSLDTESDNEQLKVTVKLSTNPPFSHDARTSNQITQSVNEHQRFYTLRDAAHQLQLTPQAFIFMCGRLTVTTAGRLASAQGLSKKFDIGLNFYTWGKEMKRVVPDFLRYEGALGSMQGKGLFLQNFQVSKLALQIVSSYYKSFPQLFDYIQGKIEQNHNSIFGLFKFKAEQVFDLPGDECNIQLVKAYLWVVKNGKSHLQFRSISSSVIPQTQVNQICKKIVKKLTKEEGKESNEILEIDPNQLCRKNNGLWVVPYYEFHPEFHHLSDRVIYIKGNNENSIQFGTAGTVIGVLDQLIEVRFDLPFIGGTDLGGRCDHFHGAIVQFTEIFNLTRWSDSIEPRWQKDASNGWNCVVNEFKPKYSKKKRVDKVVRQNVAPQSGNKQPRKENTRKYRKEKQEKNHSQKKKKIMQKNRSDKTAETFEKIQSGQNHKKLKKKVRTQDGFEYIKKNKSDSRKFIPYYDKQEQLSISKHKSDRPHDKRSHKKEKKIIQKQEKKQRRKQKKMERYDDWSVYDEVYTKKEEKKKFVEYYPTGEQHEFFNQSEKRSYRSHKNTKSRKKEYNAYHPSDEERHNHTEKDRHLERKYQEFDQHDHNRYDQNDNQVDDYYHNENRRESHHHHHDHDRHHDRHHGDDHADHHDDENSDHRHHKSRRHKRKHSGDGQEHRKSSHKRGKHQKKKIIQQKKQKDSKGSKQFIPFYPKGQQF